MGLFTKVSDDGWGDESSEEKMVEVKKTETRKYTEHTAELEFVDGSSRELKFDSMHRRDNCILLTNFTELTRIHYGGDTYGYDFCDEVFLTIPYNNLKSLETTNRERKEIECTYTEEVPVSEAHKYDR